MKSSFRPILFGAFGAALFGLAAFTTAHAACIMVSEIQLNSEKVQVVHGTTPNSDTTTMTLDLTNLGDPGCDTNDDLIAGGLDEIALSGCSCQEIQCMNTGACATLGFLQLYCLLPFDDNVPVGGFVSHTIAGHQYGTFYSNTEPGYFPTTLSAKATKLATPSMTCGRWTLNLTGTKLNLSSITHSSPANPIALLLADGDGSGVSCFNITDAVVGPVIVH